MRVNDEHSRRALTAVAILCWLSAQVEMVAKVWHDCLRVQAIKVKANAGWFAKIKGEK